jgi:hypothetical protein
MMIELFDVEGEISWDSDEILRNPTSLEIDMITTTSLASSLINWNGSERPNVSQL